MFLPSVVILAVCLASRSQRSFVETAPINEGNQADSTAPPPDASVRELESLKHSLDKTLSMMKAHSSVYTNLNGQKESHIDKQTQLTEDGKLLAKIGQHIDAESNGSDRKSTATLRTNIDMPSKGIHKNMIQQLPMEYQTITENGNRRSSEMNPLTEPDNNNNNNNNNNLDKFNSLTGIQYSPLDMADYVFWTGDEKGVTLAIEEFLQEGLMTREEAISFLQEIKYNLDYLKNHYTLLGLNSKEHNKNQETSSKYSNYDRATSASERPELKSSININQLRQEINKKKDPEMSHTVHFQRKTTEMEKSPDEDYDELLERLRVADFLYTEYSLEEVIYQLAKVMFTQSLTRGNAEAQQALQKFTNFLEVEAEQGHISRSLEKKVLDVLVAALTDTFGEHPEILSNAARDSLTTTTTTNTNDQHFLRQILEMNTDEKIINNKEQNGRNIEHESIKNNNRIPLNIGKYKNP